VIFALPTTVFFVLKSSKVQTYLTQKIIKEVSENLNAKLEVESVYFKFFNRIVLKNVYIEDQLQDTLLFSKEIICTLKKFDRKNRIIDINNINLNDAKFYLNKFDTLQPINLAFIIRSAEKKDSIPTDKPKWKISLKNIELHQMKFWYKSIRKVDVDYGVNFNDLYCNIDDLVIRDLKIENGVVDFYTRKLKFKEQSGFNVYSMKFNMSIGDKHMMFKNVKIRTSNSFINSDSLSFRMNDWDEYEKFAQNIRLDFALQESNISFKDIGFFVPIFKNISLNAVVSGRTYSKLSTFKGKNLKIHVGEQTELITDFNLNGLPNYKQMFMFVDFKKLTSCAKDFEIINKFLKRGNEINVPENFNKLGIISYKGNFSGFYDDFVTNGKFTSDLGNVITDLSLRPDTSKSLAFSGNLKTSNFNVGELVSGTKRIGKISMDAQIKGSASTNKTIKATTKGTIHSIQINDYNYQNIVLDGYLTERTYDGFLSISDPNIHLDFKGGVDFSKEIPSFNFNASIPNTNLYGLNIDRKDTTSRFYCDVSANFEGSNIDNAIGEIIFSNTKLIKYNTEMTFDTLSLISEQFNDSQKLVLKSDYIDALLIGHYKSSTLFQSIQNLYYNYLSALIKSSTDTIKLDYNNSFTLDLNLKKTSLISKFFIPNISFSDSSVFKFNYNANQNKLLLNAFTKEFKFNKHTFNHLTVNTFSNDSIFTILTKCNSLILNNYFKLENFKTTSLTHNNNIDFKFDWSNTETSEYKGKILASASISQKEPYDDPSFKITILPSQVIVKDSLWYINKSQIKIDTTSIAFSNFKINHGEQYFIINGKVSENPNDTLYFDFGDLNLAHLNIITKEMKLEFAGIINGKANFSSIFNNPLFYADLEIDDLVLNKEEFGQMQVYSRWVEKSKAIQLEASTLFNTKRTVNISGYYYPNNKNIMFNIILDKLGLNILNPYLNSFASNISGVSDGSVMLTGTLDKPSFNGSVFLQDASMSINYIKTRYNFTTEVQVENNILKFNKVNALDVYGNAGLTNGYVKFGPKKEISFNFNINANNLHALNTTGADNESFYGTAFMSGIVNINGNKGKTFLDISAKTEKDTKINIPLTRLQSTEQSGFITFINKNKETETSTSDFNIDYSGFGLNIDLEITPDAEAQLIFDSKIGDIIRGNGEGNIKMEIDNENDFKMYGDYTIEEGDYLFTLQNVINKKFKIKQGGNIIWNGEPYDANINVEAIYALKTTLTSLIDSTTSYYSSGDYKKRIPVECQVYLTEKLMNPNIHFDINLPTADEESKTLVRNAINTEEKLNKQFLSLLVLNSFMREQTGSESNQNGTTSTAGLGTVTTSELLSNQLSHWLSQISDEWDIGVNYRPGDEISKDQVEVALSTQLLDDRVSINGNVGYGGQTVDQASNIVGDFNVDVKLNKSGKLRLKAFNESNDKLLYEDTPYTQGVGIFYREEFNSFSELLNKFWNKIRGKKNDAESN
jgi:hypothetical protein